ncbi:MAG: hypothetical protein Q4E10_00110 [Porphyromonas sp.]|nr:hypothetical protein [Porphyromonas sp.]
MHKQKLFGHKRALRFTRWSRNAAASFHSLGNVVNIGRLRANVVERISLKCSKALRALLSDAVEIVTGRYTEDDRPMDSASWPYELMLLLPVTATTDTKAAQPV